MRIESVESLDDLIIENTNDHPAIRLSLSPNLTPILSKRTQEERKKSSFRSCSPANSQLHQGMSPHQN